MEVWGFLVLFHVLKDGQCDLPHLASPKLRTTYSLHKASTMYKQRLEIETRVEENTYICGMEVIHAIQHAGHRAYKREIRYSSCPGEILYGKKEEI